MTNPIWYHEGLRFECQECGGCCRTHGDHAYIYINDADVTAISEFLGISRKTFIESSCLNVEGYWCFNTVVEDCLFLDQNGACTIYPVRPAQCSTWPFWKENLPRKEWEGYIRECCPGIDKGRLYSLQEIRERVRKKDSGF